MTYGIDIDQVLRDFVRALQTFYREDYPNHWTKPITGYKLAPFFELGDKLVEYYTKVRARDIYTLAPAYVGAKDFLTKLMELGRVVLVTKQPNKEIEYLTMLWLRQQEMPYHDLCFVGDKSLINCDVLLDDATSNLKGFAGTGRLAIAFDQPWNQDWTGARVHTYGKFLELAKNDFVVWPS